MLLKLVGFCTLLVVCNAGLPVEVYYESLCPDSVRFIVEQLHPLKSSPLGRFFDIALIPYGKASFKTEGADVVFECQHGPNECYGNKVHACGIKHIQVNSYQNTKTRESLTLEYVSCLLRTAIQFKDSVFPGERCAKDLQLPNWNVIGECANSTEGSKLLQDYGERTNQLKPQLKSVPTITFNHQTDEDLMELGLKDLRSAVCRVLREPKPYECTNYNGAGNTAATFTIVSVCTAVAVTIMKLF